MVLTFEEKKIFFKNWLKLLTFVNNKYKIIKKFGSPENPVGLNINNIGKIRNKLWENVNIIEEYIKCSNLENEDKDIVVLWKKYKKGKFTIIKTLKKHTIFLDNKKNQLYGVNGITSPIIEMIPFFPIMVETVLIPFKNKIIYDSLLEYDNISFGGNYRRYFIENYNKIKKEKGIICEL